MKLRKRVAAPQLVDEPDDETLDSFTAEPPSSNVDEDVGIDGHRVESKAQKKRAPRKSKKSVPENEEPVQKRKKSNEASDQSTKEPPKKFSHSTRRNRRRGDCTFCLIINYSLGDSLTKYKYILFSVL